MAAFVNGHLGDVSPNTEGPRCIDTGLVCDVATSTCGGQVSLIFLRSDDTCLCRFCVLCHHHLCVNVF